MVFRYDGDIVMITDNPVLVRKHKPLPTLMCAQRRAEKKISVEEDFVKSNIESFGNDIGRVTNYITSMFEVRDGFDPESVEYKTLSYRIKCGQQLQQNEIDKAKGIIAKPMPRYWYDKHAIAKLEDEDQRNLCYSIVADKKPYFMRYIYPDLMKQYNTYTKSSDKSCMCKFQLSIRELSEIPKKELTERQSQFLHYYNKGIPVGTNECVMNKICKRFEQEFDGYVGRYSVISEFDYSFMRSDAEYTDIQHKEIDKLYALYSSRLAAHCKESSAERIDATESFTRLAFLTDTFRIDCMAVCSNASTVCNAILDVCYTKSATKKFAWSIVGDEIVKNVLALNNNSISYPEIDKDGDICYGGKRFSMRTTRLEVD